MVWPLPENTVGLATLATVRPGVCTALTNAGASAVTSGPVGGVPAVWAVLVKLPASRSAWVTVWEAVQLIVSPGARLATGVFGVQLRLLTLGSVTSTLVSVTLPVLVETIV